MDDAQALVIAQLEIGDYAPIRSAYAMEIEGIMTEYLLTDKAKVTKFRNAMKRAITVAFDEAFRQGYADGGGDPQDLDESDQGWLNAKIDGEWGYVDMLFQQLRDLKSEGEEAWAGEPARRAEGYARTLDGVYAEGKLRGSKNVMLTFDGEDGQESCNTCQKWKGKRHKASFWIKRGLIPGQPGNHNFECGGYNCHHYLYSDDGKVWTL